MLKALTQPTALLLCMTLLSGCASHYGAATIISKPAGAQVLNAEDDSVIGVTPLTMIWQDSSSNRQYVIIKLNKQGYAPNISHFWLSMRHTSKDDAKAKAKRVDVTLDKQ